MQFLSKVISAIEKIFVVPRLAFVLTVGAGFCFIFTMISPQFLPFIALIPERVSAGEFWRVLSFIFYPFDLHPVFAFFTYYLFFLMGSALEQEWGAAKFNLFIFLGYFGTIAVSFLTPHTVATNYYIFLSVYLAFAALHPNFELYLFFVIPVKMKWLAWFVGGLTLLDFAASGLAGKLAILVSAANFFAFFWAGWAREVRVHVQTVKAAVASAEKEATPFHVCEICRANDKTHPQVSFRMKDGIEYCQEHLPSAPTKH